MEEDRRKEMGCECDKAEQCTSRSGECDKAEQCTSRSGEWDQVNGTLLRNI